MRTLIHTNGNARAKSKRQSQNNCKRKKTPNDQKFRWFYFHFHAKTHYTYNCAVYSICSCKYTKTSFVRLLFFFLIWMFAISHCLCVLCISGSGRFVFVGFLLLALPKKPNQRTFVFTSKPKWDILYVCVYKSASNQIYIISWLCRPTNNTTNAALNKIMGRNEQEKIRHQVS